MPLRLKRPRENVRRDAQRTAARIGQRRIPDRLAGQAVRPDRSVRPGPDPGLGRLRRGRGAVLQRFKQEDRQRLLAVIEAGFGNFDEFNKGVREVFKLRRITFAMNTNLSVSTDTI